MEEWMAVLGFVATVVISPLALIVMRAYSSNAGDIAARVTDATDVFFQKFRYGNIS